MFPKWSTRSALAIMLVIASLVSSFPVYAQSDPSAVAQPIKVFLPLITSSDAADADEVEASQVDAAAVALPNPSSSSFADSKTLTAIDLSTDSTAGSTSSDEVSAAKAEVCLVHLFQGVLAPFNYGQVGAFATANTCKKINVGLYGDSDPAYIRVRYLKSGKWKYSSWVFLPPDGYYHSLLSNPKSGTLFYVEIYNPYGFYTFIHGAVKA